MSSSSHIAAVKPWVHGGKTYFLSPLTMTDLKEFELYLRDQVVIDASKLSEKLPAVVAEKLIDKALTQRDQIHLGSTAFAEAAQSFRGIYYAIWLSVRRKNPEVQLADIERMCDGDSIEELMERMGVATGGEKEADPLPVTLT